MMSLPVWLRKKTPKHFYEKEISIPLYPSMYEEDVDYVIENVLSVFSKTILY